MTLSPPASLHLNFYPSAPTTQHRAAGMTPFFCSWSPPPIHSPYSSLNDLLNRIMHFPQLKFQSGPFFCRWNKNRNSPPWLRTICDLAPACLAIPLHTNGLHPLCSCPLPHPSFLLSTSLSTLTLCLPSFLYWLTHIPQVLCHFLKGFPWLTYLN